MMSKNSSHNFTISSLIIIFLFTLKFEELNNFILFIAVLYNIKLIYFKKKSIYAIAIFVFILLLFFIFTVNFIYFKYVIYYFRLILLLTTFEIYLKNDKKYLLDKILNYIYYLHVITILLCFILKPLNNLLRTLFSYSEGSEFRISGFIQGYEFVSYFVLVYLAYNFIQNNYLIKTNFVIKLFLGSIAIILSGRFGLIPLIIFYLYIAYKSFNFKLIFLITIFALLFIFTLNNQYDNVKNTINLITDLTFNGIDNIDTKEYSQVKYDGQYNLSPITFISELSIPFKNPSNYILPNNYRVIDSGPSFLFLNFGFILTLILYYLYFYVIHKYSRISIPAILIIIILIVDIKFRSIYTLFTISWLLFNHYNHKFKLI